VTIILTPKKYQLVAALFSIVKTDRENSSPIGLEILFSSDIIYNTEMLLHCCGVPGKKFDKNPIVAATLLDMHALFAL